MRSTPAIDFLHPRRVPVLGWWILVFGVLALAVGLGWLLHCHQARIVEEGRLSQRKLAAERQRRHLPRPTPATDDERRLRQARAVMGQPWLPALAAVEQAARPPTYLLSLNIDPALGRVKLEGEAPSFDHALAFVQSLDEGGSLAPAFLTSHESVANEPAASTVSWVRFTAQTKWREP